MSATGDQMARRHEEQCRADAVSPAWQNADPTRLRREREDAQDDEAKV